MSNSTQPVIRSAHGLTYGLSPNPVYCGFDLSLGAGLVIPELNLTLPQTDLGRVERDDVKKLYQDALAEALKRASALSVPGLMIEFEHLPPMTTEPEWGADLTSTMAQAIAEAHDRTGIRAALRVTPVDIRDFDEAGNIDPGTSAILDESFNACVAAGADLIAIESVGGKHITDKALLECDLRGVIRGMVVYGTEDCAQLWKRITAIASSSSPRRCVPSGDSACGFANTAMVLAERGYIPRVFAAVVRVMSAVRSLAAFENGAVGPSKDCAYEGVYCKAIRGVPISMEGKSATFAHLSPIGNVAAAAADLWSNESIAIQRVLSGEAVVASLEQLVYDCRLMNAARSEGPREANMLKRWLSRSDAPLDPQAYVLTPEFVVEAAAVICTETEPYRRALAVGKFTLSELERAVRSGDLKLPEAEHQWLDNLQAELEDLPADADQLAEENAASQK